MSKRSSPENYEGRVSIRALIFNLVPEVLLVEHVGGRFILPGGRVEKKDAGGRSLRKYPSPHVLFTTLVRELTEELGVTNEQATGVVSKPIYYLDIDPWFSSNNRYRLDEIWAFYLGRNKRIELGANIDKEVVGSLWVDPFNIPDNLSLHTNTLSALNKLKTQVLLQTPPNSLLPLNACVGAYKGSELLRVSERPKQLHLDLV